MLLAAADTSNFRAIGLTVAALVLIAFVAMFVRNMLKARSELGSEIELAPNRKEYLPDEELDGPKLDKALSFALVMLAILAIVLPFYWLAEPGRQDGAVAAYNLSFEVAGENLYAEGAACVDCHAAGGVGGVREVVYQDGDGQFVTGGVGGCARYGESRAGEQCRECFLHRSLLSRGRLLMDVLMTRECLTNVKRYLMPFAAFEAPSETRRTVYETNST